MKYHYEHKHVIQDKWKFYGWGTVATLSLIVVLVTISGLAEVNVIIFASSCVQLVCGGLIATAQLKYKRVRVNDVDDDITSLKIPDEDPIDRLARNRGL
jgi:hypothetical protein